MFNSLNINEQPYVNGKFQLPTISFIGSYSPSNYLFTFGLHVEALFLVIVYYFIFISTKTCILVQTGHFESTHNWRNQLLIWNYCCLGGRIITSVAMCLVGSLTLIRFPLVHISVAVIAFFMAMFHIMVYYFILFPSVRSEILNGFQNSQHVFQFQQIAFWMCGPCNLCFISIGVLIYYFYFPKCTMQVIVSQFFPALEIWTVLSILIYFESFRSIFQQTKISFVLEI